MTGFQFRSKLIGIVDIGDVLFLGHLLVCGIAGLIGPSQLRQGKMLHEGNLGMTCTPQYEKLSLGVAAFLDVVFEVSTVDQVLSIPAGVTPEWE